MTTVTDYRSDIYNYLAAATDAAKWTPAMLDGALRLALAELDTQLTYETSFTVITTGYQHDLSTITALHSVLGVAYPWEAGWEFGRHVAEWHFVGQNLIYLVNMQATVGEVMRVRYRKLHAIQNLDSAATTTVPETSRALLGLWAAAHACAMRQRQSGEKHLAIAAANFRQRANEALSHIPPLGRVRWSSIGLD